MPNHDCENRPEPLPVCLRSFAGIEDRMERGFREIGRKLDALGEAVHGNGSPGRGLVSRMATIEERCKQRAARGRAASAIIMWAITTAVAVAAVLTAIFG
jgi:hypothetical protein